MLHRILVLAGIAVALPQPGTAQTHNERMRPAMTIRGIGPVKISAPKSLLTAIHDYAAQPGPVPDAPHPLPPCPHDAGDGCETDASARLRMDKAISR